MSRVLLKDCSELFNEYGFVRAKEDVFKIVKYMYDFVVIIEDSKEYSPYDYIARVCEIPEYNDSISLIIPLKQITTVDLIDQAELIEYMKLTEFEIPETIRPHEYFKSKVESQGLYVKHQCYRGKGKFMIKTSNSPFDIIKDKKCQLMYNKSDDETGIITANTDELVPDHIKFKPPLRLSGTLIKDKAGLVSEKSFNGCESGKCCIGIATIPESGEPSLISEENLIKNSYKMAKEGGGSFISGMQLEFKHCTQCGTKIDFDKIKARVKRAVDKIK